MPNEEIEWWNYNLPKDQWSIECPEDLKDASEKDKGIIGSWDEDYVDMSWEEVTDLIDLFQRCPTELRRYRQFIHRLIKDYGSVMQFIVDHRLKWQDLTSSGPPFSNPDDIAILFNDWPYGVDSRIVHLVVWVKFELEDDPVTGFSTKEAHEQIENFVQKTFSSKTNPEHVHWFKNWASLKSIHAVEHFHVMLFDPDPMFVHDITNGDMPQSERERGHDATPPSSTERKVPLAQIKSPRMGYRMPQFQSSL